MLKPNICQSLTGWSQTCIHWLTGRLCALRPHSFCWWGLCLRDKAGFGGPRMDRFQQKQTAQRLRLVIVVGVEDDSRVWWTLNVLITGEWSPTVSLSACFWIAFMSIRSFIIYQILHAILCVCVCVCEFVCLFICLRLCEHTCGWGIPLLQLPYMPGHTCMQDLRLKALYCLISLFYLHVLPNIPQKELG
jgi:hypothetical protein